jgi:type I restriction enzyme S subunit
MLMTKLKRAVIMRAGGTPSVDDASMWDENGLPWVSISDISKSPTVIHTGRCVSSRGVAAKALPVGRPGTLLFAMYASVGTVGVLGIEASWSQAILGMEPRPDLADARFVRYWLEHLKPDLMAITRSNTQDNLNAEQVGNVTFPVMPLLSQQVIADYLDRETTRIDGLLQAQYRLIHLLNERIDALIKHHIVGSPLVGGTTVKMLPLKRVLHKTTRRAVAGAPVVTAYRDGEVNARSSRREEGYTLAFNESTYQGVRASDIVIHGLDGFAGAIGTSRVDGCCSPVYHVCEALQGNDARYFARLLRVLALDGYLGSHATSIRERAVDLRNWELVGSIQVPIPSPEEQAAVGDLIDKALPIATATARISSLLQERRQALVTATVTGRPDIPEVT